MSSGIVCHQSFSRSGKKHRDIIIVRPYSIAAICVYITARMLGERRSQPHNAKIARTTPLTIRNNFELMNNNLGLNMQIKRGVGSVFFKT